MDKEMKVSEVENEAATPALELNERKLTLRSADKDLFEVEEAVAYQMETIREMAGDSDCSEQCTVFPLHNVTSRILSKVIEYCRCHVTDARGREEELKAWDQKFVKENERDSFELIHAANYLDVKSLLDLICQAEADRIKNMTVEQVRERFNIENDYTPEEEAQIRKENEWAFD